MKWLIGWMAPLLVLAVPAQAQVRTVDPNDAIDGDLAPQQAPPPARTPDPVPAPRSNVPPAYQPAPTQTPPAQEGAPSTTATTAASDTFERDDLIGAAEGVFGRGAAGLAGIIENILKDQGKPNAYIAGREAAGAFVVGLRYGSGVMNHKVEGQREVYWTGPSVGFDVGGDATKVFVLVYNLYDSQELFRRFPAAEGRAYFVGGFSASYLRRGDVVLIPVRLGVGWRLGANVGYMRFSEKQRWLPF
ncbi:EipA family protein [Sphingomonas sp. 2R-10]|uniref:EipA family protein n=1 Tax=Sphingomonas sp. 2R-10 TaxID=3045148 RepID=UPI000F76EFAE|nr:EipA family protein [Sphingomonas sp. 2R-10]MDJ0276451.1 EipA family protein [Sphingomonas sp. 2R-10]